MPTPKQAYAQQLSNIAKRFGSLEDATVKRILQMLQNARRQIAAELADSAAGFEALQLRDLQRNLARQMAELQRRFEIEFRGAIPQISELGGMSVVGPLQAAGIGGTFLAPNTAQVNALLDFSADLVRDITDDVNRAITANIRLAALGQQSPMDAMRQITRRMGLRPGKPVEGIAARAETVTRTELQRVFNLANFSQQQATAQQVPELLKRWIATADSRTRAGHLRIHNETRTKPIPVNKPFRVFDIDKRGRVKGSALLMFPLDPRAPPQYTINCRCRPVTIHPVIGVVGSSLDGRIASELERRNGR